MSEATSRRIRAVFNTFNFWCIVLYNGLALNGLDFAKLVAKRLLLKGADLLPSAIISWKTTPIHKLSFLPSAGFPITTFIVMLVTYCLVQVIKERERRQALIDDPDPLPPPPPPPPPATGPAAAAAAAATAAAAAPAAAPTAVDPSKQKAE